ncbi:hypothetical protein [Synechococcus sp. CS-1328]|uniref:hypothetical protein n=1 Tax=Synechococcus sp. CS-1328 TaxID=2847976 RepID=UPI00223B2FAF|nr:hypothetical protein [Synechococcus sp. CS-1328]
MARPRWQAQAPRSRSTLTLTWDRFVALWAAVNLLWVGFDLTYIPLRNFWLQRNLYPLQSLPLRVPVPFLPDLTPLVDPIKGIEPHRETQAYLDQFERLDRALQTGTSPPGSPPAAGLPTNGSPASSSTGSFNPEQRRLLEKQVKLTQQMIDSNPFLAANASGTLEKIKNLLRQRADETSAKQAAAELLDPAWLRNHPWSRERIFWREQLLPLVATNYWRSIDENGRPTDHFWFYDLVLFQSVFALDILLRCLRIRRRLPGLSWRDALLRRWIDLPLLLPFWRWLRLVPVVERLQSSGLINIEPLRAVISRGVVAMLAVELFEVLSLQLVDGIQQLVRSRRWPERLRALRSHQSVISPDEQELVELVRIWAPLLLNQVAPRLEPEIQGVLGHALQQSLQNTIVPGPLRRIQLLMQVEQGLSRQLANGMVESLLDVSRGTGERLQRRDDLQLELLQRFIDRFWEELASALENGEALLRSQALLCSLLEQLKRTYLGQINRASIEALIEELEEITLPSPLAAQEAADQGEAGEESDPSGSSRPVVNPKRGGR